MLRDGRVPARTTAFAKAVRYPPNDTQNVLVDSATIATRLGIEAVAHWKGN